MPVLGAHPSDGPKPQGGAPDVMAQVRLRESHHRIKNNLQIVASLLAIQARASAEPAVREPLMDAYRRVLAVARLHERLQEAADDAVTDAGAFLRGLCPDLELAGLSIAVEADDAPLPSETVVTLALVVNELATNAAKHAYGEAGGEIRVCLRREPPGWRLTVVDDGRGMAADALQAQDRQGLGLVQALVRQLRGSITVDQTLAGASVTVRFG